MSTQTTIEKYRLPSIWASYLINDDPSGIESADIEQCDKYTKDLGTCIEVSEETHFGQFKGIGYDLAEYTFRKEVSTQTKHTPGPWQVNKKVKTSVETVKDGQGINLIAQTEDPDGQRSLSEDQANAKLIAAAPELLDASQSVLTTLKSMNQNSMIEGMIMVLQDAITKATE